MAKKGITPIQSKSRFRNYVTAPLTADADFVEIIDIGNYSKVAIEMS